MFRLAHISDLHLGPLPAVSYRELASKRVVGYVNWQRNRRKVLHDGIAGLIVTDMKNHHVDHIAITGDLVNLALDGEIEMARSAGVGARARCLGGPRQSRCLCAWRIRQGLPRLAGLYVPTDMKATSTETAFPISGSEAMSRWSASRRHGPRHRSWRPVFSGPARRNAWA